MLRVEQLEVRYGEARAVREVSFDLGDHRVGAILGSNGAGKTSLGLAICGLVPYSGRIELGGQSIDSLGGSSRVSRGLVYVPEGRRVFPTMSVMDNLRAGSYAVDRRDWRGRAEHILGDMPTLARRVRSRAGLLSGGEQQLLAIARALMGRPRVLVIDEPSLGLSPMGLREVRTTLDRLAGEMDLRILILEQNVRFSTQIAEVAWALRLGSVVAELGREEMGEAERIRALFLGTAETTPPGADMDANRNHTVPTTPESGAPPAPESSPR